MRPIYNEPLLLLKKSSKQLYPTALSVIISSMNFFDRQYRNEERFGRLFLNFAVLAIFISCLGLLGLASYSTMQRTRKLGFEK